MEEEGGSGQGRGRGRGRGRARRGRARGGAAGPEEEEDEARRPGADAAAQATPQVSALVLGCIHIETSARVRVPIHGFQETQVCMYFTLIRVLYEYGLSVNFTRTSSFCAGRVFIQPVWSEQRKICVNLIYTCHDAYLTSYYVGVKLFIIRGARLVKLLMM